MFQMKCQENVRDMSSIISTSSPVSSLLKWNTSPWDGKLAEVLEDRQSYFDSSLNETTLYWAIIVAKWFANVSGELCRFASSSVCVCVPVCVYNQICDRIWNLEIWTRSVQAWNLNLCVHSDSQTCINICNCIEICKCANKSVNVYVDL